MAIFKVKEIFKVTVWSFVDAENQEMAKKKLADDDLENQREIARDHQSTDESTWQVHK